jgi:hypothetical protein
VTIYISRLRCPLAKGERECGMFSTEQEGFLKLALLERNSLPPPLPHTISRVALELTKTTNFSGVRFLAAPAIVYVRRSGGRAFPFRSV